MIIRELVTAFGIDFDETGAKQAESAAKRLNNTLQGIGIGLTFAGIYSVFSSWLGAASSVEEEMNVLQQTFGDASQGVLDWAKTNADAMSRSEFDLRKYAGQLGAVLAPMLGTKEAAAKMSEELAGLAVDLASFFNKGDEETMERLRSGILGSTEAVDQLGINLRQEHVEAVMAAEGIKKNWKELSEAEKVQYRFMTIMKDTKDKQGDAARTADSYANSIKAADANVQKLQVVLGNKLMPIVKDLVRGFAGFSDGLLEVVQSSSLFETAMLGLVSVGGMVVAGFLIANAGALLFGAGIVALLGVVEDLYTSLEGGEGYFADFFTAVMGEDQWKKVIDYWKFATTQLGDLLWEIFHPEEMEKRYGKAWSTNANTASGEFKHRFGGVPFSPNEWDLQTPGIDTRRTPVAGKSSMAEEFFAAQGITPSGETGMPKQYRGPILMRGEQSFDDFRTRVAMHASGSEGDFSGISGPMQSMADSVNGLAGMVGGISENMSPGVPMSVPGDQSITNVTNTYRTGDINLTFDANATPDTVREGKRVASELLEEQNQSLAETASSRGAS
jgi:hypothetical protein